MNEYVKINSLLWDEWAKNNCIWSSPISHNQYLKAQLGEEPIYATPIKPVPQDWFLDIRGKNVLGLASAGGQQGPIFSAMGANVTIFDSSKEQLNLDLLVSERENYKISLIQGDMSEPLPFNDNSFDLIFNPVSTTYIENVESLWKECYRILRPGGYLITAIANPVIFAFDIIKNELKLKYSLPYDPLENNYYGNKALINTEGVQFSHSLTTQIGGQIRAGFIIKDFYEDYHHKKIDNTLTETMKPALIAQKLTEYMPIYIVTLSQK